MANDPESDETDLDPLYASSIREMKWILLTWVASFGWVIGYCYTFGFSSGDGTISTTLGIPSWAFWGVFVPWIVTAVFTSWFAMRVMEDHPLEDPVDSEQADV